MTNGTSATISKPKEQRLAGLSETKRLLLERWSGAAGSIPGNLDRVVRPRPVASPIRTSLSQRRLLEWERRFPARSNTLNLHYLLQIDGALHANSLEGALTELHRRHECLTMCVREEAGDFLLVPRNERHAPFIVEDLTDHPEPETEARRRGHENGTKPFDVATGPLTRAILYRVGTNRHILMLAAHHIIMDQWSMGVVLHELDSIYSSYRAGASSPLPDLSVQYADFAYWEEKWLQDEKTEAQRKYWAGRLKNLPALLKLPGHRAAANEFKAATLPVRFSNGLTDQVKAAARANNASPYMVLLATLALTFRSLSGVTEFVVCNPVANRNYGNVERLIGFFVNNVLMRVDVGPEWSFGEVLRHVKKTCTEAHANQEYPTSLVASMIEAEQQRRDLYSCAFSYQNSPMPEPKLGELKVKALALDYGATISDFALFLIEAEALTSAGEELAGMIHYNEEVYPEPVMRHFWSTFVETTRDSI